MEFGQPLLNQKRITWTEGEQNMLDTILENGRTRLKAKGNKLGKCLICRERVRTSQSYITTGEGYAHRNCLKEWRNSSK
jgi:hypothetical protein